MERLKNVRILNGNALKMFAAILMLVDHAGFLIFPNALWLRAIGRIGMPIFAFLISEGCRYTKNKTKHFLFLFALAIVCQVVYQIAIGGALYLSILITFSISILLIYAMQFGKQTLCDKEASIMKKSCAALLFPLGIAATYVFCMFFTIDYGFWGCMLPIAASLFDFRKMDVWEWLKKLDVLPMRILCFALVMLPFTFHSAFSLKVAFLAYLSIPLLLLYNGEKGKKNLKYFFYFFYPVHLVTLQGIAMLIAWLS